MNDPLKDYINDRPDKEISDSKPGKSLKSCDLLELRHAKQEKRSKVELFSSHTKEFKAVSPSKKTALIVCIFTINCQEKESHWLFRAMKLKANILRVMHIHKLNLQLLSTYKIKVVILDGEKWNDYEPKDAICQHNSSCIHLSRTAKGTKVQ